MAAQLVKDGLKATVKVIPDTVEKDVPCYECALYISN